MACSWLDILEYYKFYEAESGSHVYQRTRPILPTPTTMQQQCTSGNSSSVQPRPEHVRALVLDYLCHNCYIRTARTLVRNSTVQHLNKDGDEIRTSRPSIRELNDEMVRDITMRERIRTCILAGRVDRAISLLNIHFPSVLDTSGERTGVNTPPYLPSSSIAPPTSHPSQDAPPSSDRDVDQDRVQFVATTLDPVHLSLNLRILAFIEACRTVPLVYTPPSSSAIVGTANADTSLPTSLFTAAQHRYSDGVDAENNVADNDGDTDVDVNSADTDVERDMRQTELLIRAQKLYAQVKALRRPADRAEYQKELTNVSGLLTYTHPEASPVARYLEQERRERVADQINSAILYYSGMPVASYIDLAVRHTHSLWATLHIMKAKLPPRSRWPTGTLPPPYLGPAKKELDEVPPFDLALFLNSKL